ncbi:MAG: glycosyltransferase family 39 protein [Terriglobales bacterium]
MSRSDEWLQQNTNAVAGAALALGFLARIRQATGTFLNPDEAQHFLVANRASLALAYKSSLTLAHPPLLIFILYFWRNFGTSEFVLRLPSIVAGTLFCWVFFKWLAAVLGDQVALLSLIFVSLLPPLVSLSSEVRQYSLLLLFMALAGYFLETSLAEDSVFQMVLFSLSLYLAMLSHYSALFFAASVGLYGLLRLVRHRFSSKLLITWALGQLGALLLFIFLYRTHISKLKGSSVAAEATEGWLRSSYFRLDHDHALLFIFGRTFGVFQFIFGNLAIGDVMGLCFIAGIVLLLKRKNADTRGNSIRPARWQLAILFVLPFVLNCAAAMIRAYPYGGTRHSLFLVVFGVAAVSLFLVQACRRSGTRSAAITVIIVAACITFARPHQPYMTRSEQSQVQMQRSITFIEHRIPQSVPLFIDVQTRMLLGYYLCRSQQNSAEAPQSDFKVLDCGGYQLIVANLWKFEPETFLTSWNRMIRTYGMKPGDFVWVIQEGWKVGIGPKLSVEMPEFKNLKVEYFGQSIQMFELTVGEQKQAFSNPAPASSPRPE